MSKEWNISKAALKSGMDRKTASKYLKAGKLPSEMKTLRHWRTRKDPFKEVWPEILQMLERANDLEANTIMEFLLEKYPEQFQEGQLRTLQRRIREWRALEGPEKEVFFPQQHTAGEALQLDFTWCKELEITVKGEPFEFMLNHVVLPFSNWEWATICFSESYEALKKGLVAALISLGFIAKYLQTDNSSTATHKIGKNERENQPNSCGEGKKSERAFNDRYYRLITGLGMEPRTIMVGKKEQNGDVESSHRVLKNRLKQRLLLRGSRDFGSQEEVQEFIQEVIHKANKGRKERFAEELKCLTPLKSLEIVEFTELVATVRASSTISVQKHTYSVPSRLIGRKVKVRLYEERLEVYYKDKLQLTVERMHGEGHHNINYRHLVNPMLKKPSALKRFKYEAYMFPSLVFRKAFDVLQAGLSERRASIEYLRILGLCFDALEVEVEEALSALLSAGERPTHAAVETIVCQDEKRTYEQAPLDADLGGYDALLKESSHDLLAQEVQS